MKTIRALLLSGIALAWPAAAFADNAWPASGLVWGTAPTGSTLLNYLFNCSTATNPCSGNAWPYVQLYNSSGAIAAGNPVPVTPGTGANMAQETGGNLATIAGAVTTSVFQDNLKQVNGNTTNTGTGASGTGTLRVATATDSLGGATSDPIFSEITDGTNTASVKAASTSAVATDKSIVVQINPQQTPPVAATITGASPTNPTSTLTMTSTTTAYSAGQNIANNGTAGSITVSSFAIGNSAGAAIIPTIELTQSDTSGTWSNQTVQVDLWSTAPTFSSGDRVAYAIATGAAGYLGSFSCYMSVAGGDGSYAVCAPTVGNFSGPIKLASGTSIFWTMIATTGTSTTTQASKVWTITPRVLN